ncbi:MAG: isochorismatase family protein [Acidimicrobiales bacterium]
MTLPQIATYPLPRPGDYPAPRVSWRADPLRSAVLIHDMQNHFIGAFEQPSPLLDEVIGNIDALVREARTQGMPVVYSAQPPAQDPVDRGLLTDFWGIGLQDGASAAIAAALAPHPDDHVLTKWRYNAFIRTPLLDLLHAWGRDQLIVVGVYAHIGCLLTAADAFMNDVQPFFVADAVADFSRDDHLLAVRYAANRCARVLSTEALLADLTPSRQAVS